jgi:hypothetical protein
MAQLLFMLAVVVAEQAHHKEIALLVVALAVVARVQPLKTLLVLGVVQTLEVVQAVAVLMLAA